MKATDTFNQEVRMSVEKYDIVIGRRVEDKLLNTLTTGLSFLNEGEEFYSIKLMMFPGQTYYLAKNRNSPDRYTIFAKLLKDEGTTRFQNPVGSGRLNQDLPSHMELYFPVLRSQMYMCLFPSAR
jgi:hypothetical protein